MGVTYLTAPVITARHCFTTRLGGVSKGYLAGLNLGENRGDDPENVKENYRRLGAAAGIHTERMAFTRQVHGSAVRIVTEQDVHVLGTPIPYEADGIVTDRPGLALICFTADCVPVLLHDPVRGVVGAVHCGWRSSVADILAVAVEKMASLGASPALIRAAIGPAIGKCCFEVGPEVIAAAENWLRGTDGGLDGLYAPVAGKTDKYLLDLRGCNARRLRSLGLAEENIAVSGACTVCSHETFWSHRYTKGQRGSQAALIELGS